LPFMIFAHVDEPELLARVELPFDLADGDFADARPGVLAEFFKCFRMLHHYPSEKCRANWQFAWFPERPHPPLPHSLVQAQRVEQISSEFQRALLPVHRVFFQGAEYLGFDHDINIRIERAQRGRPRIEQFYAEIADALRGERRSSRQHFVSYYAQAVNVRAKIGLLSAKLFRAQVSRAQRQLSASLQFCGCAREK